MCVFWCLLILYKSHLWFHFRFVKLGKPLFHCTLKSVPFMCVRGRWSSRFTEGSAPPGQAALRWTGGATEDASKWQRKTRTGRNTWWSTLLDRTVGIKVVDKHSVSTAWPAGGAEGGGATRWTATQGRAGQGGRGERRSAGEANTTAR